MPGVYGHVFCKRIREHPLLHATTLVLISAKTPAANLSPAAPPHALQGFANDSVLCNVKKGDEELQLNERELEVFAHVDGQRTLRELVKQSPFQEPETLQICQRLSRVGVLRPKTAIKDAVG